MGYDIVSVLLFCSACLVTNLFVSGYPGSSTEQVNTTLFFFTAIKGKLESVAGPGS